MDMREELIILYPSYIEFINERWGDEDYYGDERTEEEMFINIEIDICRNIDDNKE